MQHGARSPSTSSDVLRQSLKPKADKQAGRAKPTPAPMPAVPSPELLELSAGVFEADGKPLQQLALAQLGPTAEGVALVAGHDSAPYLTLAKAMSSAALGLLVLGRLPACDCALACCEVRFQAK